MNIPVLIANLAGWPAIHLVIAKAALQVPLARFSSPNLLKPTTFAHHEIRFYKQWLRVSRWKTSLPDGAPWLGGFTKKRLAHRDRQYLFTFLLETRRAEFAHWCMFGCLPVFFLWNPPWACAVMTAYAIAANLPCILAQRYNRLVLAGLLRRIDARDTARRSSPRQEWTEPSCRSSPHPGVLNRYSQSPEPDPRSTQTGPAEFLCNAVPSPPLSD